MSQATEQSYPAEGQNLQRSDMPQQTPREEDLPTERMPKLQMLPEEDLPTERLPKVQLPPHQMPSQPMPGQQTPPQALPPARLVSATTSTDRVPTAAAERATVKKHANPPVESGTTGRRTAPPDVPLQQRPPNKPHRRFGCLALLLVGAISLTVGTGLGALGLGPLGNGLGATTAVPAETVTATATKTVIEPTAQASPTKTPEPTDKMTTAKPKPSKTAESTAVRPTKREWAKVVKNPEAYSGQRYIIYGQVTQFDSARGTDTFRADTAHTNTTDSGSFDGDKTILTGDEDDLSNLAQDDVFRASVTVIGSFDYDTPKGRNATVPHLTVNNLKVIENNG